MNPGLIACMVFLTSQVAAVSGDARRALDICRRATELAAADQGTSGGSSSTGDSGTSGSSRKKTGGGAKAGTRVGTGHINRAVQEMFSSPKIVAIQ